MTDDVLRPGTVVADTYDVERLIGRGAMGEVFAATHRRLPGLKVAIKVMNAQNMAKDRLTRFRREAEIAAKLSHPNIVQVIDFNTLPTGQPYLVMEYLRGESLHARLKRGPMELQALKQLVREVGAGLDAAHRLGAVHRDLKPENIFLVPTPTGDQAKLLDFGISKIADGASVQTSDSTIIGTPRYMSPEQARGFNSKLTPVSDIYSFATVCYEALAGKSMFVSDNVAHLLYQITAEPHVPLISVRPDVPLNVSRAIERALAKDPAQRTPDVATFVRELTGTTLAKPTHLTPALVGAAGAAGSGLETRDERKRAAAPPAPSDAAAFAKTHQRRSWLPVAGVGLLTLALAGVVTAGVMAANERANKATQARAHAAPAAAAEPVASHEGGALHGTHPLELEGGGAADQAAAATPTPEVALEAPDASLSRAEGAAPSGELAGKGRGLGKRGAQAQALMPISDEEQELLSALEERRDAQDWEGLAKAERPVLVLPIKSAARRKGMLLWFEAVCARREVTVTSTYNRLLHDYPDSRAAAVEICRRYIPDFASGR